MHAIIERPHAHGSTLSIKTGHNIFSKFVYHLKIPLYKNRGILCDYMFRCLYVIEHSFVFRKPKTTVCQSSGCHKVIMVITGRAYCHTFYNIFAS